MSKCKNCGYMNDGNFKNFICAKCDFVNEGDIHTVKVENVKSLLGVMGEQ